MNKGKYIGDNFSKALITGLSAKAHNGEDSSFQMNHSDVIFSYEDYSGSNDPVRSTAMHNFQSAESAAFEHLKEVLEERRNNNLLSHEAYAELTKNPEHDPHWKAYALSFLAMSDADSAVKYTQRVTDSVGTLIEPALEGVVDVPVYMGGAEGRVSFAPTGEGRLHLSHEAFDPQELIKSREETAIYNFQASRQDPATEMFFPTVTLTPDEAANALTITRRQVIGQIDRKSRTGEVVQWDEAELQEAYLDPDILRDNTTELVPYYSDDTADKLLDVTYRTPSSTKVGNADFLTQPIRVGVEVDYVALSSEPGLMTSDALDTTDAMDRSIRLKDVFFIMRRTINTTETAELIRFNVLNQPDATYQPVRSGNAQHFSINYGLNVSATASTPLDNGGTSDILALLGGFKLRISTFIGGQVDVRKAHGIINTSAVKLQLFDDHGVEVPSKDDRYTNMIGDLRVDFASYFLDVNRTNSNLRGFGKLLDTNYYTERYPVQLKAPIHQLYPATDAASQRPELVQSLIQATNQQVTQDGITALLNHVSNVEQAYEESNGHMGQENLMLGLGRFRVRPYFERQSLDVVTALNNIETKDKFDSIRSVLTNRVRDVSLRLIQETGYLAALWNDGNGTSGSIKPKVGIATGPYISGYLQLIGDPNLLGPTVEAQIEVSVDDRMKDIIVLAPIRNNSNTSDILNLGNHYWVPEVVYRTMVSRQGTSTRMEIGVQRRNRHVAHLPAIAIIEVSNLRKAVEDATKYITESAA